MVNMFGQIPGMQEQMQRGFDMIRARQEAKNRSLIGGGAGNSGVAQFPVQSASPAGGFAASKLAGTGLGAGGFAVAPAAAAATAAPELAAETPSGDLGAMAAAAAATPDPYNNAVRTPQQDAVGQIQGNAFMRQQSMQGLV